MEVSCAGLASTSFRYMATDLPVLYYMTLTLSHLMLVSTSSRVRLWLSLWARARARRPARRMLLRRTLTVSKQGLSPTYSARAIVPAAAAAARNRVGYIFLPSEIQYCYKKCEYTQPQRGVDPAQSIVLYSDTSS